MRLVFVNTALNDECTFSIPGSTGSFPQTLQGGTTGAALPGNPPLLDEIWYSLTNNASEPRMHTFSGCGPSGFDSAVAAYRGRCGALVYDGFDDDGCGTPGGLF
jgi:hypothetical protein